MVYNIKNESLLKVEIALVNTYSCKDLLSLTSLVESHLVDIAAKMDNKILSAMARKRVQDTGDSTNAPTPKKRDNVGLTKISTPALPPPLIWKNKGEKSREKSPESIAPSTDRALSPSPWDWGDHLVTYKREYSKVVGPKLVKEVEGVNLTELRGSLQKIAFQLTTVASCYKLKAGHHEKKQQTEIHNLQKQQMESIDRSKEKMLEMHK